MARRVLRLYDLVDLYRRWQAGEGVRQMARNLRMSRNTVREYVRAAEAAGFSVAEQRSAGEWEAFVQKRFPEVTDPGTRAIWWPALDAHRDEIAAALKHNRVSTVWQRMREAGKVETSLSTFRRYVRARLPREVDPNQVVVHGPEHAPGELAEVDFGRLGLWSDPVSGKRSWLYAFIMVVRVSISGVNPSDGRVAQTLDSSG